MCKHFFSETEVSQSFLCTTGMREAAPHFTAFPPAAFLLPLAHRARDTESPSDGTRFMPQFKAPRDKLWYKLQQCKKLVFLTLCLVGITFCQKEAHANATATSLQTPPFQPQLLLKGLYPTTLGNLGKEEEQIAGHEHFLGWHAKFCQAVPVSIPITLELFKVTRDSNHSKSLMSVQSSQHIASTSSFIPPSLTGHPVDIWVLQLHLSKSLILRVPMGGSHSKDKMLSLGCMLNMEMSSSFRSC